MKIIKTLATTAVCTGPDSCPTIYLTDHNTLLIQGAEIAKPFVDHGVEVPAGEALVEIPESLIVQAVHAHHWKAVASWSGNAAKNPATELH